MRRERWIGVAVFALALAIRLAHVQQVVANDPFYDHPSVDSRIYIDWATRIAAGDWLGSEPFFLSPLYGYFLGALYALFGVGFLTPLIANAFFGACTCVLVYAIGCRVFDRRVGIAGASLFALYRMEIFYEGAALLEALQTLASAAVVWSALRALAEPGLARFALAGGLLGLAVLGRENAILFGPAFAVWAWFALRAPKPHPSRRAGLVFAYLAGAALVILPATAHNWIAARDLVLVNSTGGIVLYTGWNPQARGVYMVPSFLPRSLADDPVEQKDAYRAIAEQSTGRSLSASQVSSFWRAEAWEWIRTNPGRALALGIEKARLFWNAFEFWDIRSVGVARQTSWVLRLPLVSFGWLAPLALAGLVLTAERWRELVPLSLLIAVQFATAVAFIVLSRYRIPAIPALAVYAGAVPIVLYEQARARHWRRFATGCGALAVGALVVNTGIPTQSASMAHYNLGNAYKARGEFELAIDEYLASLETAPSYLSAWNNLALAYEQSGADRELVIRTWERVLDLARAQGSAQHVERAERYLRALTAGADPTR